MLNHFLPKNWLVKDFLCSFIGRSLVNSTIRMDVKRLKERTNNEEKIE